MKLEKLVFSHSTPTAHCSCWTPVCGGQEALRHHLLLHCCPGARGLEAQLGAEGLCLTVQPHTILYAKPYQSLSRFGVLRLKVLHN